jgi:hypothetical protein
MKRTERRLDRELQRLTSGCRRGPEWWIGPGPLRVGGALNRPRGSPSDETCGNDLTQQQPSRPSSARPPAFGPSR